MGVASVKPWILTSEINLHKDKTSNFTLLRVKMMDTNIAINKVFRATGMEQDMIKYREYTIIIIFIRETTVVSLWQKILGGTVL